MKCHVSTITFLTFICTVAATCVVVLGVGGVYVSLRRVVKWGKKRKSKRRGTGKGWGLSSARKSNKAKGKGRSWSGFWRGKGAARRSVEDGDEDARERDARVRDAISREREPLLG